MKDEILSYIQDNIISEATEIKTSDDLLTTGLMDSMAVMRLITFIEQKKGITIPPQDLVIEHFISVDAILNYLETKK